MLYLVRKIDQSIIINDEIELKVLEIKGRSVKLGFESPPNVSILRKEIHDRIIAENLAAAKLAQETGDADIEAIADIKLEESSEKNV